MITVTAALLMSLAATPPDVEPARTVVRPQQGEFKNLRQPLVDAPEPEPEPVPVSDAPKPATSLGLWTIDRATIEGRHNLGLGIVMGGSAVSLVSMAVTLGSFHGFEQRGWIVDQLMVLALIGSAVPVIGPLATGFMLSTRYNGWPFALGATLSLAQGVGLVLLLTADAEAAMLRAKEGVQVTGISLSPTPGGGQFAMTGRF